MHWLSVTISQMSGSDHTEVLGSPGVDSNERQKEQQIDFDPRLPGSSTPSGSLAVAARCPLADIPRNWQQNTLFADSSMILVFHRNKRSPSSPPADSADLLQTSQATCRRSQQPLRPGDNSPRA